MRDLEARVQTISLAFLALAAFAFTLFWFKSVLIPFTLSIFVALALSPLVEILTERLRVPRILALGLALGLVIVSFAMAGLMVSSSMNSIAADAGDYQETVREFISSMVAVLPDSLWERFPRSELEKLTSVSAASAGAVVAAITNTILSIISQGSMVLIFVIFLLVGGGAWSRQEQGVFGEMISSVRRYLVLNVAVSAVTGFLVGLILYLLGIPLAAVFGLLAFLLNFIPTVGSIIAWALPLPVVMISPDVDASSAMLAMLLPGLLQLVVGNIITPKVMGDSLDLHPVVILVALMFWGVLWGGVGMVLATPLTAVTKILMSQSETTRPIADVMAGRLDRWVQT